MMLTVICAGMYARYLNKSTLLKTPRSLHRCSRLCVFPVGCDQPITRSGETYRLTWSRNLSNVAAWAQQQNIEERKRRGKTLTVPSAPRHILVQILYCHRVPGRTMQPAATHARVIDIFRSVIITSRVIGWTKDDVNHIRRVAAKILNTQSGTDVRGWSSSWGVWQSRKSLILKVFCAVWSYLTKPGNWIGFFFFCGHELRNGKWTRDLERTVWEACVNCDTYWLLRGAETILRS